VHLSGDVIYTNKARAALPIALVFPGDGAAYCIERGMDILASEASGWIPAELRLKEFHQSGKVSLSLRVGLGVRFRRTTTPAMKKMMETVD